MSLRTIQRVGITSSLLLGAIWASGCDDDDGGTGPTEDAGVDGGGMMGDGDGDGDMPDGGDGDGDGDVDAGPFVPTQCTEETAASCGTVDTGVLPLDGCCDTRSGTCGGIVAIPQSVTPLDGCHGQGQPGTANTFCGDFFDKVEDATGDHANGKFDITLVGNQVSLEGCCSDTGVCGVVLDQFTVAGAVAVPHFGCVPVTHFIDTPEPDGGVPEADAGPAEDVPPPFCVPGPGNKGATCPPSLTVELPGQDPVDLCALLTAKGAIGCDPTAATPDWVCETNGLTSTKTGEVPELAPPAKMEYMPEFVSGCGDTPGPTCVANVAQGVFGAVDIDTLPEAAQAMVLAAVPETVCGCGDGVPTGAGCLPNVGVDLCGSKAVEAGDPLLASYPKFLCGCEENTATELGCLRGVPKDVCGTKAETDYLPLVPTFVCGCGDTTHDSGFGRLCMSNVAQATCGTKDTARVDRGEAGDDPADCLEGVPEYASGCGVDTEPSAGNPTCLRDTLQLFGCENVPNAAPAIPRVPEYLCGCGEETAYTGSGLPCLSFVGDNTTSGFPICGAIPITATAQVLPVIPNTVCGCGDGTQGDNCLDNVPATVCGPLAICTPVGTVPGASNCANELHICASHTPISAPDAIGDTCELPAP